MEAVLAEAKRRGLTQRQLADEQGVTPGAVGHWEQRFGITLVRAAEQAQLEKRERWGERLADAHARGLTRSDLARIHDVSTGQIGYWERLHDIVLTTPEQQWHERLTDAQAHGYTDAEVAQTHNVHPRTVQNWQRRCGIELPDATAHDRDRRDADLTDLLTDARTRGLNARMVAAEQGVDPATVRAWQERVGVYLPKPVMRDRQQQTALLHDARRRGLTASELAQEQYVHLDTVAYWQKRCGIDLITLKQRWAATLHDAQTRQLTRSELSVELDVTTDKVGHWERTCDVRLDSIVDRRRERNLQQWNGRLEAAAERGLDRAAVAAELDVHPDTVRNWERRCNVTLPVAPSLDELQLLRDARARDLTRGELAAELAVRRSRIARWEQPHGIRLTDGHDRAKARRRARWAAVLDDAAARDLTREAVAAEQQVHLATVRGWEKVCGTPLPVREVQARHQRREWIAAAVTAGVSGARTAAEVASELGVSPQVVYWRATQMDVRLAPARTSRACRPTDRRLEELLKEHGSVVAVALDLGAAASTVRRWCIQDGLDISDPDAPETHPWDDPARLGTAIGRGMTVNDMARDAGTDATTVRGWLSDYGLGQPRNRLAWAARTIADRHNGDETHGTDRAAYKSLPQRERRRLDVVRAWLDRDDVTLKDATERQLRAWVVACHRHGSASNTILESTYALDRYDAAARDRPRGAAMRATIEEVHRLWGSNPTPRRTVAAPLTVLRTLWNTTPDQVLAATSRLGLASTYETQLRLLRIWVAVAFANGCRGQSPGHLTIDGLLRPGPKTIRVKAGIETLHTGHTPGCSMCPRCEVNALLAVAPDVRRDVALHDLVPSRDLLRKQWLRAARLPEYAVTLGTARVTVATLMWQRTHNLVKVEQLLGHADPGGHSTTRYIQTLPELCGLDRDDFDQPGWFAYAAEQYERRRKGRLAAATLPSMGMAKAVTSAPIVTPGRKHAAPAPTLTSALWWWTNFLGGDLGVVEMCSPDPRHPDNLWAWAVLVHTRHELRTSTVRTYAHALASHLYPTDTTARNAFLQPTLAYLTVRARVEKTEHLVVQPTLLPMEHVARWTEICYDRDADDLGRMLGWGFGTAARPGSLYAITTSDVAPDIGGIRNVDVNTATKRRLHDTYHYSVPVSTTGHLGLMLPDFGADRSIVDGVAVHPSETGPRRPDRQHAAPTDWKRMLNLVAQAGETVPSGTSPMTLRHSSLTYDWDKTRDLLQVQRKAGHASPMTTLTYLTRVSTSLRTQAGRAMASHINRGWAPDLDAAHKRLIDADVAVPPGLLLL